MTQPSAKALHASLAKLHISTKSARSNLEPADSWEDEADAADEEDEEQQGQEDADEPSLSTPQPIRDPSHSRSPPPRHISHPLSTSYTTPAPPPPTPSTPTSFSTDNPSWRATPPHTRRISPSSSSTPSPSRIASPDQKRPEKTTAVASRLIAAGIGQKVAKRSKEERDYDQAMRLQVKKEREKVKAEEERREAERERAKREVWGD